MSEDRKNTPKARRWDPDSARRSHIIGGPNSQFNPDYNTNQGKFPPTESEYEIADTFGLPAESELDFDFEALKKLFNRQ
jgi:hypothetical protein